MKFGDVVTEDWGGRTITYMFTDRLKDGEASLRSKSIRRGHSAS